MWKEPKRGRDLLLSCWETVNMYRMNYITHTHFSAVRGMPDKQLLPYDDVFIAHRSDKQLRVVPNDHMAWTDTCTLGSM